MTNQFFIPAAIMFLSFLCTHTVLAQGQTDTLQAELEPIQVDAIRSTISPGEAPLSLTTDSRSLAEINSESALTLDMIVNHMPGIWVKDRENYALGESITIRGLGWRAGFGVRGIQVVMDDIPLTVADGQSMLTSVDPSFISNVQLIRGPASSYWGNSSGGVLYLSTLNPSDDLPLFRSRTTTGSYGLFKEDINVSKSFGKHKVAGYTSYLSEDGYRDHSAVKISRSGLKGSIDMDSESRLEYMGAFVAMPQAQHPSGLTEEQLRENPRQANSSFVDAEAGKEVYQGQAGLNYYRNTSLGFLTLTGYGIYRDLSNPLTFGIIEVNRRAGGFRGTLEQQYEELKLNFGFDSKLQHDDRKEYENNEGSRGAVNVKQLERVSNQALFATSALSLDNLKILGGLRFDWLTFNTDAETENLSGRRTFHALSPSLGLAYTLSSLKLFGNLSTSFEAPTTTELVNRPDGGNGFNPDLKPERTVGLEFGTRGSLLNKNVVFDVALYQIWIQDLLFPYQLEENGAVYYRNQGETRHRGIEGQLSMHLLKNITAGLTYNYTNATFIDAETLEGELLNGNKVPGIPNHRFVLNANYSSSSILFDLSYQFADSYPVNNVNSASNDSYGLLNAGLSIAELFRSTTISIQPFVNVNNLLDENYNGSVAINAFGNRYYEPSAGRNWQLGISVEFY